MAKGGRMRLLWTFHWMLYFSFVQGKEQFCCSGDPSHCLEPDQVCDGKQNCPWSGGYGSDYTDEDPELCEQCRYATSK